MSADSKKAVALDDKEKASLRPQESIAPAGALYIPSLDGIRAISFFLVFFSHAGLGGLVPGGFGVSIFFLLSGFLITTLLRLEYARYQRISLGKFYLRRVLRILPPLYISLLLAMALSLIGKDAPGIPFSGTLAQALQVSNFYEIYSTQPETMPGTGVLWSLAVEEHFYLIFPMLYGLMCSRLSVRQQALFLLALCLAALVWRCILCFEFHSDFVRTYYGTDTRFDSILFGCVFAIIANPVLQDPFHRWFLRRMRWLLPFCIAVLLLTFLYRDERFRATLRYTVQAIALIPLFIAAICYRRSWLVFLLNLPLVRFIGVLSYSLYLCHFMILATIERVWSVNPVVSGVVSLGGALCFSAAVHYWIERPCTSIRKRLSDARAA